MLKSESKIYVIMKKIFTEILNKYPCVKSDSKIYVIKKIFIEIMNKKIRVLNQSQNLYHKKDIY